MSTQYPEKFRTDEEYSYQVPITEESCFEFEVEVGPSTVDVLYLFACTKLASEYVKELSS